MKRLAVRSLQIALVLGCSVGTALAWGPPPGGSPPKIGSLITPATPPMVYPDDNSTDKTADKSTDKTTDKLPAKKPAASPVQAADGATEKKPAARPSLVDQAAALREQELQTLLRRQKVCLQLMQIAEETNDKELLHRAEQLDERAREIYTQHTADLPVACTPGLEAGIAPRFESDEQTLGKHLGPTSPANRGPASQSRMEEVRP